MLRALLVAHAVASSAELLLSSARAAEASPAEYIATAADAEARAEHIVQLCAEHHRDSVAAAWDRDAYHIRHLPSLRGLVVEATQAEVAALKAHDGVCTRPTSATRRSARARARAAARTTSAAPDGLVLLKPTVMVLVKKNVQMMISTSATRRPARARAESVLVTTTAARG